MIVEVGYRDSNTTGWTRLFGGEVNRQLMCEDPVKVFLFVLPASLPFTSWLCKTIAII